ncbi:nucleotide sugar dehydrogenase, partial [Flavobacterium sp.]|uniref:nucleotide sugar dehydrogenase n=1 Tax=Flavobacterium sp. TaxID=239 RepID=UPI003C46DBE2
MSSDIKIGIVGLGYVGLPLARLFATKHSVVGYDINEVRISQIQNGIDSTQELSPNQLNDVLIDDLGQKSFKTGLLVTTDKEKLSQCNYYVITVPTPVDKNNKPNLNPLYRSSETVALYLKKGDIVIYESTVYPGLTEEECVPVLERFSNLKFNVDFFVGYSPERINPGDKLHTVDKILKITSGSTPQTAQKVNDLYLSVITAGTYLAPSIKVAEAAKVIENSQRDINIAFVNELAKIFSLMKIDTQEVLAAAATKWNFLPFKPGLVGGHCIGVDPYYLAQKAQELGYHPEIILAGRRLNDSMGDYIASQVVKLMIKNGIIVNQASLLMLGITFKENCPDVRNTKIVDLVKSLLDYGIKITIYDPLVSAEEVYREYQLESVQEMP